MNKKSTPVNAQQNLHPAQDTSGRQASQTDEHDATWDAFVRALTKPNIINPDDRSGLDALSTRYPRLFTNEPLPWGLQIGAGWTHLVTVLCARIDTLLRQAPSARFHLHQVKEKFGGLRFYYEIHGAPADIKQAIRNSVGQAELASNDCCERCGAVGAKGYSSGYLVTLCPRCASTLEGD